MLTVGNEIDEVDTLNYWTKHLQIIHRVNTSRLKMSV